MRDSKDKFLGPTHEIKRSCTGAFERKCEKEKIKKNFPELQRRKTLDISWKWPFIWCEWYV